METDIMARFNHYFALFEDLKKGTRNTANEFSEVNCRLRVELMTKLKEITMEPGFQRQYFPFEIMYIDDVLAEAKSKLGMD